jgi:hypothetical protein
MPAKKEQLGSLLPVGIILAVKEMENSEQKCISASRGSLVY